MIQFFHWLLQFCNPVVAFVLFLTFVLFFKRVRYGFFFTKFINTNYQRVVSRCLWDILTTEGLSHPDFLLILDYLTYVCFPHTPVYFFLGNLFFLGSGRLPLKGWRAFRCRTICPQCCGTSCAASTEHKLCCSEILLSVFSHLLLKASSLPFSQIRKTYCLKLKRNNVHHYSNIYNNFIFW